MVGGRRGDQKKQQLKRHEYLKYRHQKHQREAISLLNSEIEASSALKDSYPGDGHKNQRNSKTVQSHMLQSFLTICLVAAMSCDVVIVGRIS